MRKRIEKEDSREKRKVTLRNNMYSALKRTRGKCKFSSVRLELWSVTGCLLIAKELPKGQRNKSQKSH